MNLKEQHNRDVQGKIDENRDKIDDIELDLKREESKAERLRKEFKQVETLIGEKMIEKRNAEKNIESLTSTFWMDSK